TLDADTEGDLTHGEGLTDATALTADDNTLEELGTGVGAFDDLDVNVEGVTGAESRNVVAQVCGVDLIQNVHVDSPLTVRERGPWRHFPCSGALGRFVSVSILRHCGLPQPLLCRRHRDTHSQPEHC